MYDTLRRYRRRARYLALAPCPGLLVVCLGIELVLLGYSYSRAGLLPGWNPRVRPGRAHLAGLRRRVLSPWLDPRARAKPAPAGARRPDQGEQAGFRVGPALSAARPLSAPP